jgi:GNAT superfamily N-acetyltransferase
VLAPSRHATGRALHVRTVEALDAIAALPPVAGAPAPDLARLRLTRPELHLVVTAADDDAPLARASVWWGGDLALDGRRVGRIGHYAAHDADAGAAVLDAATQLLRARGCGVAVGPMDGSTWFSYRFVTDRRGERAEALPPFALEPDQPDAWPAQWTAGGFTPLASYSSSVVDDLGQRDPRLDVVRARAAAAGLVVRSLDPAHFDAELDRIHAVAVAAFRQAFLYTPVDRATVHALYGAARAIVIPELVLVAEHEGRPVGFAFSLPDHLEAARTGRASTLIVKTVAVLPGRLTAGLGALLAEETHHRAARLGMTRAVHALMHEHNTSLVISRRQGQVMRRYTLFQRPLGDAPAAARA